MSGQLDALELILEDEVDDAAERIRTVGRRRAACDDFDAVDQQRIDNVEVDHARIVRRNHPAAVDQNQSATGAKAAHIDRNSSVAAVVDVGIEAWRYLRQLVQGFFDVDRALILQCFACNNADRRV